MPSKPDCSDLEQSIGRDAFRLESGGNLGVIACVWLAFYVLAVMHSLLSHKGTGPITTAEALESSHVADQNP
jgi:hypothetical protein